MNIKIFLTTSLVILMFSCTEKEEKGNCKWHPYDIMQRVKLVDEDGKWIEGIEDAKLELIAYDTNWENPLFDKNGNTVKQIFERIEARKKVNSSLQYIELYMAPSYTFANNIVFSGSTSSYFILKVDDKSFKITTNYITDFNRCNILKTFSFEGKLYPVGSHPEMIIIKQ